MRPREKQGFAVALIFLVTGTVIGIVLGLQWKSGVPKESLYPLDQLELQKKLLQEFVDEEQKLEKDVAALREEIENIQKNLVIGKSQYREALKTKIGLAEISGEGIEVFLTDSPHATRDSLDTPQEGLVHAADLRDIVNLLFSAGAKAIAINGRRVLPLYSFQTAGNTFLVNDVYTFPPFIITAIGSPDMLRARLDDETFLPQLHHRKREHRLRFSHQIREKIVIPGYTGSLRTNFLSLESSS